MTETTQETNVINLITAHQAAKALNSCTVSYYDAEFVAYNDGSIDTRRDDFLELMDQYADRIQREVNRKIKSFGNVLFNNTDIRFSSFAAGMTQEDLELVVTNYICFNKISNFKWRVSDRSEMLRLSVLDMIEFYQSGFYS